MALGGYSRFPPTHLEVPTSMLLQPLQRTRHGSFNQSSELPPPPLYISINPPNYVLLTSLCFIH